MLKQAAYFLISIVVLLALFVAIERTSSPFFQSCITDQQETKSDTASKENPSSDGTILTRYVNCSGRFIEGHGVGITALATVIIAAFTCTLWIATSQQAQLTREAFIADKRAFVFASGIQPVFEPDIASGHFNWRIGPIWHNSGDTATQGLQIYTDGFLSNVPIPPNFDFNQINANVPPGAGMLGPKMFSAGGQAPHMPHPALTPQDILDIQNGRRFFYLWGWARYHDTLPNTQMHITRYCWRIISTGNPLLFNPLVDPNGVRFFNLYEARGNCADEECRRQNLG